MSHWENKRALEERRPRRGGPGTLWLGAFLALGLIAGGQSAEEVRLITLAPGHFHAALFCRERLAGVSKEVWVFAPLGPDLTAHLNRLSQFNARRDNPTHWKLRVYAGSDFWERFLEAPGGNVLVLSGNNRGKIERITEATRLGLHILADKPWIIEPGELSLLQTALEAAAAKGVVAYDAMTQRYEIAYRLLRELANDREVFGAPLPGSKEQPSVRMTSTHYLLKEVAGIPTLRPAWFFDVRQQGEGLADVGTHLVDLVQWILLPDQAVDFRTDLKVLWGSHWPTVLTRAQFQRVTGESDFPSFLSQSVRAGKLEYFANNAVGYVLRGVHARVETRWDFEAAPGSKDSESAVFCGARARLELRQGAAEGFRPEVCVFAAQPGRAEDTVTAVRRKIVELAKRFPGLGLEEVPGGCRVVIPDAYRVGHEAHFALLVRQFLEYVRDPGKLPAWEKSFMLAKYYVTTKGVELARAASSSQQAPGVNPPGAELRP
jgi:predicted dehydrogenase